MTHLYRRSLFIFLATAALNLHAASTQRIPTSKVETPALDVRWIHGHADPDPEIQTFALDADTWILRQNIALNFEAPFLYLLFGRDRAVLLDTGAENTNVARKFPLRETVDRLLTEWCRAHHRDSESLLVMHTHSHDDHVAGDGQFENRAFTEVVGTRLFDILNTFKINSWPKQTIFIELGGRRLQLLPTPGHDSTHLTLYDPQTETLFTGDAVYPGRLFIKDWKAYRQSIAKLAKFTENHPVKRLLGGHIEISAKGVEYPETASYHPEEHALELGVQDLLDLNEELKELGEKPPAQPVRKGPFKLVPQE